MRQSRCIAAVLKGLNKGATKPAKQKKFASHSRARNKNAWQPLLLLDGARTLRNSSESIAKKGLFMTSAVTRYWDQTKAREMVSSGPSVARNSVSVCEPVGAGQLHGDDIAGGAAHSEVLQEETRQTQAEGSKSS